MSEELIAKNIKGLRKMKGATLQELADKTGLTKGYLSRIERSEKAPPFSTITKIASALGVDVSFLLRENLDEIKDVRISVTKKGEGKVVDTKGTFYGYKYEALGFNKPGKNMIPYIIEPVPEENTVFQHEGEEFIYVLEGKHEFNYGGKKFVLEEGDSVYFDSGVPHTGRILGNKKVRLLAIIFNYKKL